MHPILADRRRLQLYLIAWALVGSLLGLLVRVLIGVGWVEAMVFGLPLGMAAAPLSLSGWYLCRVVPLSVTPPVRLALTAVGAALVTAVLWSVVGYEWWQLLAASGFQLSGASMRVLTALLVGVGALAYLISVAVHYMWQAFEASVDASNRMLQSEIAQREAELRALRAQVDPHFLFNSLNSISGLITADPDRSRQMCVRLADFLRDSLTLGTAGRIPLKREVALAEQYLGVEQVRFGDRLRVLVSVSPEAAAVPVPPLLLQPIVENAVRHGVATMLEGGVVEIGARLAGERLVIEVRNPCDPSGSRRGTGFGIDIVRRRLAAAFGDRAALVSEPGTEAYRVTLTMPIEDPTS